MSAEEQFKFNFDKTPSRPEISKPSKKSIDEDEEKRRAERLRILGEKEREEKVEQERQDSSPRYGH